MTPINLNDDIRALNGVGEKRAALFNKIGVKTVSDLLRHYPEDFEDRTRVTPISALAPFKAAIIKAVVVWPWEVFRRSGLRVAKAVLKDGSGAIKSVWFNRPHIEYALRPNTEYIFIGKTTNKHGNTEFCVSDFDTIPCLPIKPKYRKTAGLTDKALENAVYAALREYAKQPQADEVLPAALVLKNGLYSHRAAVFNIHRPASREAFLTARRTLVFEELYSLRESFLKTRKELAENFTPCRFTDFNISPFIAKIPFELTSAQKNAVSEIIADLKKGVVMNRLLQGDVACGKTVVAACACYICVKNGYQAGVLAPTEILAKQHFEYFYPLFASLGYETALLTGSAGAGEKALTLKKIESGRAHVVIATHAAIYENVKFSRLALTVTDEQHRFGVEQRRRFAEKGACAHALAMSATPIPRTLALALYGDLDVTTIEAPPPNRQKISTYAVSGDMRQRVLNFVKNEIELGNSAYFVCPIIKENPDGLPRVSVTDYYAKLKQFFSPYETGVVHGKMKQAEKEAVMERFRQGRVKALVATTVVETGVDVPGATVMVIEDAHCFGLAALHQLRGRVGRGEKKSYCVLISDAAGEAAKNRLKMMTKTQNGFILAEADLRRRGHGDFFGSKQSGHVNMKITNLYSEADMEILRKVWGQAAD